MAAVEACANRFCLLRRNLYIKSARSRVHFGSASPCSGFKFRKPTTQLSAYRPVVRVKPKNAFQKACEGRYHSEYRASIFTQTKSTNLFGQFRLEHQANQPQGGLQRPRSLYKSIPTMDRHNANQVPVFPITSVTRLLLELTAQTVLGTGRHHGTSNLRPILNNRAGKSVAHSAVPRRGSAAPVPHHRCQAK